jgi:hypothetical protein
LEEHYEVEAKAYKGKGTFIEEKTNEESEKVF